VELVPGEICLGCFGLASSPLASLSGVGVEGAGSHTSTFAARSDGRDPAPAAVSGAGESAWTPGQNPSLGCTKGLRAARRELALALRSVRFAAVSHRPGSFRPSLSQGGDNARVSLLGALPGVPWPPGTGGVKPASRAGLPWVLLRTSSFAAICTLRFGECVGEGPRSPARGCRGPPVSWGELGVPLQRRVGAGGLGGVGCCFGLKIHKASVSLLAPRCPGHVTSSRPWEMDPAQHRGGGVVPSPRLPRAASAQGSHPCRNQARVRCVKVLVRTPRCR